MKRVFCILVSAFLILGCHILDRTQEEELKTLIGVWDGTWTGNQGFGGKQILIHRDGERLLAAVHIFPLATSPAGFPRGSYLANLRYNEETGVFELIAAYSITGEQLATSFAVRRGRLTDEGISGSVDGHAGSTIALRRIAQAGFPLVTSHNHVQGRTPKTVDEVEGEEAYEAFFCIFCDAEMGRFTAGRFAFSHDSPPSFREIWELFLVITETYIIPGLIIATIIIVLILILTTISKFIKLKGRTGTFKTMFLKLKSGTLFKFVCPHCIKSYKLKRVLYTCPDCSETSVPKRFEREPIKCKKKGCDGKATQRKCPECGQEITKSALETPNLTFCIVGSSASGKTSYITIMLHELVNSSGLHRLSIGPQDNETKNHQNANRKSLFEDHQALGPTLPGQTIPQKWQIKNLKRKRGDHIPTYTLTIFDGAGEEHENNLDRSSPACRYMETADAIIIALDPFTLLNIRKGGVVDEEVMRNSLGGYTGETKNSTDIIHSVARYIKDIRGIKPTAPLKIPVAVILTKFDAIADKYFSNDALLMQRGLAVRSEKVSIAEIKQANSDMHEWLNKINETAFIDALEAGFKNFYLFGVSSFGEPPKAGNVICEEISPRRVLDPILWLFKDFGFID